jgi:hypothetical protein
LVIASAHVNRKPPHARRPPPSTEGDRHGSMITPCPSVAGDEALRLRSLDAVHLDAAIVFAGRGEIARVATCDYQLEAGCAYH